MNLPARLKPILILSASALAVCLGALSLMDRASWPQASDGIVWVKTARGLEVGRVTSKAGTTTLQPGDLLTAVNDIPVGNLNDLTEIQEILVSRLPAGTPALYRTQDGSGRVTEHRVQLLLESSLSEIDAFLSLAAIGFLAIGLFIFLRNWTAVGAFHFYLICLVAFMMLLLRHSGRADAFDLLVYWVNAVAFLLLPALLVHFCLYFPRALPRIGAARWLKPCLYLPASFLGLLHVTWFLGWLQPLGLPRDQISSIFIDQVELLHFVAALALCSVLLWWKGRHVSSPVQRQQMKWITHGSVLGSLPFTLFYGIPYLAGWPINLAMEASVLSLLLIPLGFGYAITRYRLMDVDLIFKRSAAYLLATSTLLGLYVVVVVLAGQLMQTRSGGSGLFPFALGALAVAFLFAPLKSWIQDSIDRHFYKDRYDYRKSFSHFGRTLSSETSLPELARKISEGICQTLHVERVGIFLRREPGSSLYDWYNPEAGPEEEANPASLEMSDPVLRSLGNEPQSLLPDMASDELAQARKNLRDLGFRHIQPLEARERLIGFLALGAGDDGEWLSSDDLQLVETIADYASIALDNAVLYQSLESHAAQLAELKVYSDNVIESITVGVVALSPLGEITTWNSRMEMIYESSAEEMLGKNISEVFPPDLLSTLRRFIQAPKWEVPAAGRIHKVSLTTPSGHTRMVAIGVAPLVSTHHLDAGTLILFDDISEKTQLENQLLQAEKLSSIGLFAAGVAHEVNTPLAGISSYSQMLIKETPDDDPRKDLLQRIERQSFRASEIVNNLLKFARVSENDFQEVNLNSLVVETVSLLDHPLKKAGVGIRLDLDPSLPATVGSGGKLQQVFMNLFLNARDAMPKGGEVQVRTFRRNSTLIIQVEDQGEGISEDHVKKIYDPFFTTKDVGKGTGLGLAVSYGIIQEHSGRINVESQPGVGTIFTLELPLKRVQ